MKLGVLLAGRTVDEITSRFEQARDAGFFLCQLNLYQSGISRADVVKIADAAVDLGVRPLAIGCQLNPLNRDDAPRTGSGSLLSGSRADLDLLLQSLDILGARRIVLWSGTYSDNPYDDHPDNAKPECLDALRDFLTDVVYTTRCRHYFLCLEPWRTHVLRDERAVVSFHESLEPRVQERVRYVLDASSLITRDRYDDCDAAAAEICRILGPLAGVVHLRDVVIGADTPDGERPDVGPAGPCQGRLDYSSYLQQILSSVDPDVPAIVRNVAVSEFATVRDQLLQLSGRWEVA